MRKLLGLIALSVLLAGCSGPNTNISTIQFSGSTEALPANFAELATKAVEALPVSPGQAVTLSEPRTIVGTTAFSPRRWYVCASGLAAPAPKPATPKPVLTYLDDLIFPPQSNGRYDVIVVFNALGHTSLIKSYDAVLCNA